MALSLQIKSQKDCTESISTLLYYVAGLLNKRHLKCINSTEEISYIYNINAIEIHCTTCREVPVSKMHARRAKIAVKIVCISFKVKLSVAYIINDGLFGTTVDAW